MGTHPTFTLDHFNNWNSSLLNEFKNEFNNNSLARQNSDPNSRIISIPNVQPENVKINVDKTKKTISISATEIKEEKNDQGCEFSSSSSCSYKFQLPENVKFDSLKSEFDRESGNLTMNWEVEREDNRQTEEQITRIPVQVIEE